MKDCIREIEALEDTLCEMYATRMGKDKEEIRAMYFDGKDHWLRADEALALGLAAKGDDGGHAGGDAVHVDGNVGLAVLQGIENGDARINLAAVAVDTHVHLPGQGFRFQKFTGNITAAHVIIVLTDVTVKKDATGIGSGYHIEKSTHVTIVLAGPSLQSLRCEIRGIKSLFQTAFSSWRL